MEIQPDKQNIDQTFSTTVYHIDFYQREYKWGQEPVQRLLDDVFYTFDEVYAKHVDLAPSIENINARYPWYYLNTYVTNQIGGQVYVVDGQQRLTTLTLILFKLLRVAKTFESKTEKWLENKLAGYSGMEHRFWMNHVRHLHVLQGLMEGKALGELDTSTGVTAANMVANYRLIAQALDEHLTTPHRFETFVFFFLQRLVLINLAVDSDHVPMVFEVINDRGVRLKPHEILKGKLLGQIDKLELESGSYNELWENQVRRLNAYREDEIDNFFRHWLKAKFSDSKKDGQRFDAEYHREMIKSDLDESLHLDHNPAGVKTFLNGAFRYYTELYLRLWEATRNEKEGLSSVYFNTLNDLESQFMLILAACDVNDPQEILKIEAVAAGLNRLFSLLQLQGAYESNAFGRRLNAIAADLRSLPLPEIVALFDRHLRAELVAQREEEVQESFAYVRFRPMSIDRMNTRFTRYFFARVERLLAEGMRQKMPYGLHDLVTSKGPVNGFHIEHILSFNDENRSLYDYDEERFLTDRNRLGGVLLLKGKDNISSSNEVFGAKLKTYVSSLLWNETLCEDTYKSNLDLKHFIQSNELDLRPLPTFGPEELEARHRLLFDLTGLIWPGPPDLAIAEIRIEPPPREFLRRRDLHAPCGPWLALRARDAALYDRARTLFPPDVVTWVQESQPKAWERLVKNQGAGAETALLRRLRDQLDSRGTLDVLRHGIELIGLSAPLKLAEFRPAMGLNPEILARYGANRLRVVRQVRYSKHNENAIDLVLFLNGIPVATVELKTDFTQNVGDAVDQYRFDRHPSPKGQGPEPLLLFPNGALVHFAVSNAEVRMTTRLEGPTTEFLPFNRGDAGAAGNPPNPDGGHRTAYLWEEVWERESWLEILGRYLVTERDAKKAIKRTVFPRYHQLDVTRRLMAAVRAEGPGNRYLIQHSAGSGKTKSIAWTAHFLAELHDAEDRKLFDTVLVISDRNVIDSQLREALFDFQRQAGVVATITNEDGSKSAKLAEALNGSKKVVVCTIQTFPFALKAVRELTATQGKRFAVIADEAHSSQTGEAASKLKEVLSPDEIAALADGAEVSSEDVLAATIANRADDRGLTFVAFTATPKSKTMELFGTRPDPSRNAGDDNRPLPFHVYSMRQAIEEGFILDVLQNYTTYKLAFRLAHNGRELSESEVERSAALKAIMRWVRLHPYNIAQKVQVVVEHYREMVRPLLGGKAKAMVVVGSRQEAVRWQLAMQKYIGENGYGFGTLVAFSGEVRDEESGPDPFTETSSALNPGLKGRDIREAFKREDYGILLVANKFQTGFDQPLLCGMYVDKRLGDVQAVQTLSRLNRAHPGKDTTYVLDFVNEAEAILSEFRKYYTTAELAGTTDPNLVFDLRAKLDALGLYDDAEVNRVVAVEMDRNAVQSELVQAIDPVRDRVMKRYKAAQAAFQSATAVDQATAREAAKNEMEALVLFRADMATYLRVYTFLSQIFDYGNTAIEKRAIFYKRLIPLLEFERERTEIDMSKVVLTHHKLRSGGQQAMVLDGESPKLQPLTAPGSGMVHETIKVQMAELIAKLNDLFGSETTESDQLVYVNQVLMGKLMESDTLRQQAAHNTKEQFANSPDLRNEATTAIIESLDAHTSMSAKALNSPQVLKGILDILLSHSGLYENLRNTDHPATGP